MDWHLYPSGNYDQTRTESGLRGELEMRFEDVNLWMTNGMRRSVLGLMLAHVEGHPHALLIKRSQGSKWWLAGGVVDPGVSDSDALNKVLRDSMLKCDSGDLCQWKIGELVGQYWRPEFDEYYYPYLPPHVSRPKELLRVYQVFLPPRCVFSVLEGYSLASIPIAEIVKGGRVLYGDLVASIPYIISRAHMKYLVPSAST